MNKSFSEKLLERTPIALIGLGLVVYIVAAADNISFGSQAISINNPYWKIGLGILGTVLFIIGLQLLLHEAQLEKSSKKLSTQQFPTIAESMPSIINIATKIQDSLQLDIIAATGGTTLSTIIPLMIKNSPAKNIDVSLFLVNPESPFKIYFPKHWNDEISTTVNRLKTYSSSLNDKNFKITLFFYDTLPVLHGVKINNKYLLLGFFAWRHYSGKYELTGSETPHRLFSAEDDPDSSFMLEMFNDWVKNMPSKKVFSSRRR